VSGEGAVTGIGAGKARITAKLGDKGEFIAVVVTAAK
jgi:hypothetical protein